jgi:glycosyltransferase involved in cell wall biosynthesis
MQLRINFALWGTGLGGGTRAIFEVANRLAERGHHVQITALSGDHRWFPVKVPIVYVEPPRVVKFFERCVEFRYGQRVGCDLAHVMLGKMGRIGLYIDSVRALVEAAPECDINIATWYPTCLAVWVSGKGKPYYFMQDFWEQIQHPYERRLFQATLKLPFVFLANSNYAKEIVLSQQPGAKIRVANVGVDSDFFCPAKLKVTSAVQKPIVMGILQGLYFKGDDALVEVLNQVNREVQIEAFLVGTRETMKSLSGAIEFSHALYEKPSDKELARLYCAADVFLYTPRAEGFGLPGLEAMACGTPTVCTDCKGNRDYAIHSYNCLMAAQGNILGLKELVITAIKDTRLRDRLIRGGLETARKFSWERTADEFESAFGDPANWSTEEHVSSVRRLWHFAQLVWR